MIEPWFLDSFQAAYWYCKPFLKLSQDLFNYLVICILHWLVHNMQLHCESITVFPAACTHFKNLLPLFFITLNTNPKTTHKMPHISEALHSKYHKHISKTNICKHLSIILIPVRCLCVVFYEIERFSVWFCRCGVFLLFEWQLSKTEQGDILCVSSWRKLQVSIPHI